MMYEKILKKLRKNAEKDSQKLLKNHFNGKFMKFSQQFSEEFTKYCAEISNSFRKKVQRNPQEILEIFEVLLKICPGLLHSFIRLCINAYDFIHN